MTMFVQDGLTRLEFDLIGLDQLTDALADAAAPKRPIVGGRHAPSSSDQARSTSRKRRNSGRESIDSSTVAMRLNRLFDTIRPPGRGPLRNYEVIEALRARGIEISAPYLSQLRVGRRSRPSLEMLRHLADAFGVSVAYFTDADSTYTRYLDAELSWLEMVHDSQVRTITTALLTLPPDVRENILQSSDALSSAAE